MQRLAQEEAELAARFAQARRNDPCPCGSGKKFKHCHGRA
ncbi:MAG TPA: SEC-C metal-binding domain-containing protein [Anaerolineae bacterium]|nr:SEC-C metal-binding domain-containing protein [Anaerolineae bacterium]HQI86091.1 SEC-C metal-binding domain-containing protein [Anaerolineae bacterium]